MDVPQKQVTLLFYSASGLLYRLKMGIFGPSFSVTALGGSNCKRCTNRQDPLPSAVPRDTFTRWEPPHTFSFDTEGVTTFLIRVMELNDDESTMVIGEVIIDLARLNIKKGTEKVLSLSLKGSGAQERGEIRVGVKPNYDLGNPGAVATGGWGKSPEEGRTGGFVQAKRSTQTGDAAVASHRTAGSSGSVNPRGPVTRTLPSGKVQPRTAQGAAQRQVNSIAGASDQSRVPSGQTPMGQTPRANMDRAQTDSPPPPHTNFDRQNTDSPTRQAPTRVMSEPQLANPSNNQQFAVQSPGGQPPKARNIPPNFEARQAERAEEKNRRITMMPTKAINLQLRRYDPQELTRNQPPIAKGSFGVVYTGRVPGILKPVVIKDMTCVSQQSIDEWQKELVLMSQNGSDFIAEVFGFSATGTCLTIVMEFFPMGDLFNILHTKQHMHPLSTLQRMRMARHCSLAVAFLHKNGVVHRDIKSMNILCTEDYACKLTDFGTAKVLTDPTLQLTANEGTPVWMAPEVKFGQYGPPCDVYSLGLVLFEIFVGNLAPYWNQQTQSLFLPNEFKSSSIVHPCIAPQPQFRPTALQVSDHLDSLIKKTVNAVKNTMSIVEQEQLKQAAAVKASGTDPFEGEILVLYYHLLKKPAAQVDQMIDAAFNPPK